MGESGEKSITQSEHPLGLQIRKETQEMIARLKVLGLDDPTAPGMTVFGESGSWISILHGQVKTDKGYPGNLVISPEGFFFADPNPVIRGASQKMLDVIHDLNQNENPAEASISSDKDGTFTKLKFSAGGEDLGSVNLNRIQIDPNQFGEILRSSILSSREIQQKPQLNTLEEAKQGNRVIQDMIMNQPLSQPPSNPGPTI